MVGALVVRLNHKKRRGAKIKMTKLESVSYEKVDGELRAIEKYEDGSTRSVKLVNGVTDYILNGGKDAS